VHVGLQLVEVFENSTGSLALRLVEALKAAQSLGGDIRGQRSAALLVVRAERSGRPWRDNVVDIRVDDHPEPLSELERMTRYSVRYHACGGSSHDQRARPYAAHGKL